MAKDEGYYGAVRLMYENRATSYENSWHPAFVKRVLDLVPDQNLQPGSSVLDLACGTGLVSFHVLPKVAPSGRVIGIDLTKGMLDVARAKKETLSNELQSSIVFVQHDMSDLDSITELQGLKGTFDLLSCVSALVLLPDAKGAVAEWSKWLKPGTGRLILDVTHPWNLRTATVMDIVLDRVELTLPWDRKWSVSEESFRELLVSSGELEVEKINFVEQEGFGTRYYRSDPEEAGRLFDKFITADPYKLVRERAESLEKVRESFIIEWGKSAGANGMVEEVDGDWVGLARRKG